MIGKRGQFFIVLRISVSVANGKDHHTLIGADGRWAWLVLSGCCILWRCAIRNICMSVRM